MAVRNAVKKMGSLRLSENALKKGGPPKRKARKTGTERKAGIEAKEIEKAGKKIQKTRCG